MLRRKAIIWVGVLCGVWMTGCTGVSAAPRVASGSSVELHYSFDADGKAVVPAARPETMRVVVGQAAYPPEFERQLIGLKVGDNKRITLRPEQAFGPYRREQVFRVPNAQLPPGIQLSEGMVLGAQAGQSPMRVIKVLDDSVVVDRNHPLAGKTLDYRIKVSKIE
ncbi:MAG: hypothetical protein MOGMAGMI_00424 [Candidatus Omnitrophica bacterium]|nr:hypothetical protein [Candidatus Omnitrophota bacterium]